MTAVLLGATPGKLMFPKPTLPLTAIAKNHLPESSICVQAGRKQQVTLTTRYVDRDNELQAFMLRDD